MAELKKNIWRYGPAVILLAVFVFLAGRFSEIEATIMAFGQVQPIWIFLSFAIALFNTLLYAGLWEDVLFYNGIKMTFRRLYLLVHAASTINIIAPSAGLGGIYYITSKLKKGRDISLANLIVASMIFYIIFYISFLTVFAASFFVASGEQTRNGTNAAAILTLVIIIPVLLSLVAFYNQRLFNYLVKKIIRLATGLIDFFRETPLVTDQFIREITFVWHEQIDKIKKRKIVLTPSFMLALAYHIICILSLKLIFISFNYPISAGALAGGYSVGLLLTIISITPSGLGVVELAMTAVFVSLGVPVFYASAATLLFRAFYIWLPFAIGLAGLRKLKTI